MPVQGHSLQDRVIIKKTTTYMIRRRTPQHKKRSDRSPGPATSTISKPRMSSLAALAQNWSKQRTTESIKSTRHGHTYRTSPIF
jgi:hypothetical protein